MARILCVANQKGGVGKTTTSVNLAVGLAKAGCRTLLIDFDPQCNATTNLGCRPTPRHLLTQSTPLGGSLVRCGTDGLDLLPGSLSFPGVEALCQREGSATVLQRHLSESFSGYDFVLIDCPSSLGPMTEAAFAASTEVLIPIQCEYFAMEGMAQMIHVIRKVRQQLPDQLEFGGVLLTMYDAGLELSHQVDVEVREFFGEIVFEVVIPREVAVAEASSRGQSVLDYSPRGRGARAYIELCMEVLRRE